MASYGWNPYPRRYGGGKRYFQVELEALLDRAAPGWDGDSSTESYAELYAYALAIAMIWAVNGRTKQQVLPSGMAEDLPTWEQILKLGVGSSDSLTTRRARVAAKLRAQASNALGDIYDTAAALGGSNFLGLAPPAPANVIAFQHGINPGPPGREYTSNQARISVQLSRGSLSDEDFFTLVRRMRETLQPMAPTWVTFAIGANDGGFKADFGQADLTLLAS